MAAHRDREIIEQLMYPVFPVPVPTFMTTSAMLPPSVVVPQPATVHRVPASYCCRLGGTATTEMEGLVRSAAAASSSTQMSLVCRYRGHCIDDITDIWVLLDDPGVVVLVQADLGHGDVSLVGVLLLPVEAAHPHRQVAGPLPAVITTDWL